MSGVVAASVAWLLLLVVAAVATGLLLRRMDRAHERGRRAARPVRVEDSPRGVDARTPTSVPRDEVSDT